MHRSIEFTGFSPRTASWLNSLKKNNTKDWFQAHRAEFDEFVMAPARTFVSAMGKRLQELSPNIIAVPKVNRSIFRIHRDTRFSPDKSPYKIHLGVFFWEGIRPRMECSGFYFHLEPPTLTLGVGLYVFPKNLLEIYRNTVVHPERGAELAAIIQEISRQKNFSLGGKHYKRIPSGYDASHPNADLLLHNGLYAGIDLNLPPELYSPELIDFCQEKFRPLNALHRWLVQL